MSREEFLVLFFFIFLVLVLAYSLICSCQCAIRSKSFPISSMNQSSAPKIRQRGNCQDGLSNNLGSFQSVHQ